MKKFSLILALLTLTGAVSFAQKAYEGKIRYKKIDQPALAVEYNYPVNVVENALKAKMADLRLKYSASKGFISYNNSVISTITPSVLDYTFKTMPSGKTGKEKTILYMIMEGGNNIAGDAVVLAANGKSFLESLTPEVKRSNTIFEIKKQEDLLVTEEKKLKTLKENYEALDQKMQQNLEEQRKQSRIIASQKSILEDLKAN
ncbi:hypothetical protein [Niabella drilacis]|uniref:DUF4468 domain-containing protein n=1 Tax=Niabella drilacis (strain DSM 25811 / CCM 8410 / CCUG 62505 / LMG 26954 / E90) TaxID=1285928 RepID=A0A1G6VNZ1_NIADE|nr:hypothetical protein [Niabella drilacis]SDD55322.1 hypothetical protein SAMN04487894_110100 [Niabella drilacis]